LSQILPFAAEMPTARFHENENPYFLPITVIVMISQDVDAFVCN